jgi:hypothetical protein
MKLLAIAAVLTVSAGLSDCNKWFSQGDHLGEFKTACAKNNGVLAPSNKDGATPNDLMCTLKDGTVLYSR